MVRYNAVPIKQLVRLIQLFEQTSQALINQLETP